MPSRFSSPFASIVNFFFVLQIHVSLVATHLALPCTDYAFPHVICMNRYGTLMPQGFHRDILYTIGFNDYYSQTHVPGDTTFTSVANASFLVWDEARGSEVLGGNPQVEFLFTVSAVGHEAPVYEPNLNLFFFSALQANTSYQYVVDLNVDPPALSKRTSNPPINLPTGATFHDGLIYTSGSATTNGIFTASINTLNASTGQATPILNNYFGYKFTTIDDLAFAPNGDIWFTDECTQYIAISYRASPLIPSNCPVAHVLTKTSPGYGIELPGLNKSALPQLEPAVYRFVPRTGLVQILTDTFVSPNGIAFSPDGLTVYITDTPVDATTLSLPADPNALANASTLRSYYAPWNRKTIYAFDVVDRGVGLANPRALFLAQDRIPDGIKLAQNGYIVTATGHGVDVLDPAGVPIVRVQTNFSVVNLAWAGEGLEDLWLVGVGGVARVKWGLKGHALI